VQTLERTAELQTAEPGPSQEGTRRWWLIAVIALVVVLATAGIAYAVGSSSSSTKTVVKTVEVPAKVQETPKVDDRGFSKLDNGEQAEENIFELPMDAATRATLQHQLTLARDMAMKYPTVADAEAAGWRRSGPFAPGLGAHYFNYAGGSGFMPSGVVDDNEAVHPAALIYDGTQPTSRVAGLMYYSLYPRLPKGFAGENDIWHYHTDVCIVPPGPDGVVNTPFGADTTVTKKMCDGVHGNLIKKTSWMLHAWVVPGYDSPQGVFSHLNEAITCRDGTYKVIDLAKIGNKASVCVDGGE
jgi:hypothetical protein